MRKNIVVGYIVFVHLFLLLVLVKSDFIARAEDKVEPSNPTRPEITHFYNRILKYHKRIDANVPNGAVIFIGDSLTQGLCVSAVVTPSVNFGIGSDTTVGVLKRLPEYHSLERASICVIAIGVNDLKYRNNKEILNNYLTIIKATPPHLPLIFSAVLPVEESADDRLSGYNQRIRGLNKDLKALCETQSPKCIFVDPSHKLEDSSGNLKKDYCVADGVHLNGNGNAIWIQELKGIIQKTIN